MDPAPNAINSPVLSRRTSLSAVFSVDSGPSDRGDKLGRVPCTNHLLTIPSVVLWARLACLASARF